MEGKTVILSVLIMNLVMTQIQVEAKICCRSDTARITYNLCRAVGGSERTCAPISACIIGNTCAPGFQYDIPNYGVAVNEYCKLGCASSVCGALTTLQNSDASEIVNGAVEQCTNACSTLCTNGPVNAVEIA